MTPRALSAPPASSPAVRSRMRRQPSRDTGPERRLRAELVLLGLRYRVQRAVLPRRTADVAFPGARVAVFVDGCFWHGCPVHHRPPRSNAGWWSAKVAANRARDADTDRRLAAAGWAVVRVRECEDPAVAAAQVASLVRSRAASRTGARARATAAAMGGGTELPSRAHCSA